MPLRGALLFFCWLALSKFKVMALFSLRSLLLPSETEKGSGSGWEGRWRGNWEEYRGRKR